MIGTTQEDQMQELRIFTMIYTMKMIRRLAFLLGWLVLITVAGTYLNLVAVIIVMLVYAIACEQAGKRWPV